jgi:phosphatidylglycerophosphate synthase
MLRLPFILIVRLAAALVAAGLILWGDHAILTQGPGAAALIFGGALAVFGFAGLSDVAGRKAKNADPFQTALDGAADKVLIAAALLALAATLLSRDLVVAAILLMARDIAVLGLRHGLAQTGRSSAPPDDKLLNALAMAGVGAVLLLQTLLMLGVGVSAESGQSPTALLYWFAQAALWIAALLGVWTAYQYARSAMAAAQSQ